MSFQDVFFQAPPVTRYVYLRARELMQILMLSRTITAAAVLISVPGHLGLYNLAWVVFFKDYVFTLRQLPQIWRAVTCFFITGPSLGLIMDPFFLYHYSSQLETGAPRFSTPGSYAFYLIFVGLIILSVRGVWAWWDTGLRKLATLILWLLVVFGPYILSSLQLFLVARVVACSMCGMLTLKQLSGGLYLGGAVLLSALNMALIYTFAQEDPNRQVQFFIVQMPAKYLPYASLAITYLMAGPFQTMIQATGILAAHLYDFLDRVWPEYGAGTKYINTPQFIQKMFAGTGQPQTARSYGTAFAGRPANQPAQNQSGGPLPSSWASGSAWSGSGRRLGGD